MSKISLDTIKHLEEFKKFINAVSENIKDQTAIRTRYSECEPLKLQLSFDHLIEILRYILLNQTLFSEIIAALTENKDSMPKFHSNDRLPRKITLFPDSLTRKIVLIIFLGKLLADQKSTLALERRGQTKAGSPCYAITLVEDKLKFLEHYAVKTPDYNRLTSGYRISTMMNSPYITKYKLINFLNNKLGLLSSRGLFKLVDIKHFTHLLEYRDLLTICYSLFKGMCELHHAKITHRDMIANWIVFKDTRMDVFYVKMIDFDFAQETPVEDIKCFNHYFNHDLYDIGLAISARVFNDNYKLLNHGQQKIYQEVVFGIQELANFLMAACVNQEKSPLTADKALQHFMEIIKPIRAVDSVLNNKIQHMQEVLEIPENNQPGFHVRDAENNAESSSTSPLSDPDTKEVVSDTWLSARRAIAKDTLSSIDIKPDTDLGDKVYPLGYAIMRKKWRAAHKLMDNFIFKKLTLNQQTSLITFNRFPDTNVGLLNLIIEEKKLEYQQRKIIIEKLVTLKADVFYQSTVLGSPLRSALRMLQQDKQKNEPAFWEIIELLFPENIFLAPNPIALPGNLSDPAFKDLLTFSLERKKLNYIKIAINHLNSEDFDEVCLLDILVMEINIKQVGIFFPTIIKKLTNPTCKQLSIFIQAMRNQQNHELKKSDLKQQSSAITYLDIQYAWRIAFQNKFPDLMFSTQSYLLNMPASKEIAHNFLLFINDNEFVNHSHNNLIIHLLKTIDPAQLALLVEKVMSAKNWLLTNIFLESKVIGIDYEIKKKSIFECCVENFEWDSILNHIKQPGPVITRIISRSTVRDSALYWAIQDKHVKAVQILCENGFNVDEVRFTSTLNKKSRQKPLHIFQAIKNLKLPPTSSQENLFAIVKCLLQYTNQINFNAKSYKPNVNGHTKTKHISNLMCYLIELEEIAMIREFVLNKNFEPIVRVHYQLYNFIDYTIMKNKLNVLAFFSEEIGNLKEFIASENIGNFLKMQNALAKPKLISSREIQRHDSLEDKKIEETKKILPIATSVLPREIIINECIITDNTIDGFRIALKKQPFIVNSVIKYPSGHSSRLISVLDFAARKEKWEFVLELLEHGTNYNFIMEFGHDTKKQQCSFFQFILNKSYKSPIVRQIVLYLLKKPDLDVYTHSSSNESVSSSIQRLLQKDSGNAQIYEGFRKGIFSLWSKPSNNFVFNPLPDEKKLNQLPEKQTMVGHYTLFDEQKNVLFKRKKPELTLKDTYDNNQFKKPCIQLMKKVKRAKGVNLSFDQQTPPAPGSTP